jgi:hypothetical protein
MFERKKENRQIARPYTSPEFTAHCGMGHKALKNNDRPSAPIASFYLAPPSARSCVLDASPSLRQAA